ncbi:hypothetical protein CBR_g34736 [Chara braunii]|uniref:Uncharacterized protein n=1 Tax=Chara braunii TaxID=69332 RepID=A0A388JZ38_CHABU|nr:hypothetical protein CBR_g34736 [Chara braunii]|eukprot:GBG63037.1 hypothetical protein CBR_g34736 [Chara braunii]
MGHPPRLAEKRREKEAKKKQREEKLKPTMEEENRKEEEEIERLEKDMKRKLEEETKAREEEEEKEEEEEDEDDEEEGGLSRRGRGRMQGEDKPSKAETCSGESSQLQFHPVDTGEWMDKFGSKGDVLEEETEAEREDIATKIMAAVDDDDERALLVQGRESILN